MAQTQQARTRPQQQRPQQPPQGQALAVVGAPRFPLPAVEAQQLGIGILQWRNATDDYWPNAKTAQGIVNALSFCKDHDLDPGKRVCHVVPIWSEEKGRIVDTIWPSIAAVRMIATRTGLYVRTEPCVFGADKTETLDGVQIGYPQWAQITVVRLDANGNEQAIAGPRLMWREYYAPASKTTLAPNAMWRKKPYFMLEKCAEAAALRRGFPENIGNQYIVDESHQWGTIIDVTPNREPPPRPRREDYLEHKTAADVAQPNYIIVNIAGEEEEHIGAEATAKAIDTVWQAARRINKGALDIAKENNGAALDQLRQDGHGAVVDSLLDSWNDHWTHAPEGTTAAADSSARGTAGRPQPTTEQGPRSDAPDRSPAAADSSARGTQGRGAPDFQRQWDALQMGQEKQAIALIKSGSLEDLGRPLMSTRAMQRMRLDEPDKHARIVDAIRQRVAELQDDARGG